MTPTDMAILDFEDRSWHLAGAKEAAIREVFDITATRYYQRLAALLHNPHANAYAPMLVSRLRRVRTTQQARRVDRRRSALGG